MIFRNLFTLFLLISFLPSMGQKSEDKSWYVKDYNETKAKQYFDLYPEIDKIEGIWQSTDGFKYSIEKDVSDGKRSNNRFRVIILESSVNGWNSSEIKGFIEYGTVKELYSMKYYTKNILDGTSLSSENILLLFENPVLMSFQKLNGEKINLYKLYPKNNNIEPSDNQTTGQSIEKWSGSCFAIGNKLVATNYHVIDNAEKITITGVNGRKGISYEAEVVLKDPVSDLAVLNITDNRFEGFSIKYGFKDSVSDVGTSIFVLGYPLTSTMGEDLKLTTGVISSKTGFQSDVSQYQISAPIQPGNSGGPLFDEKGNIIGIVSAKHLGAENVGYAIKLGYLKNLLDTYHEPTPLKYKNSISPLSLPEKIKLISPCVLMVEAYSKTQIQKPSNINYEDANAITAHKYMLWGDEEKAYEFYKKTDISILNKEQLNEFARCSYFTGHFDDALIACKAGLDVDPRNPVFNRLAMYSNYELGNYSEAKHFIKLYFNDSNNVSTSEYDHFYAALIYKALKETSNSLEHFNKTLELINDSSMIKSYQILRNISETYLDINSFNEAIHYYTQYLECQSKHNSDDLEGLAKIYSKYADADETKKGEMIAKAITVYREMAKNFPNQKIYATYQCAIMSNKLDKNGEKGLAKADFQKVVDLLANKADRDKSEDTMLKYSYHYLMTIAFLYGKNKALAKKYADMILVIDPEYPPAQQIRDIE